MCSLRSLAAKDAWPRRNAESAKFKHESECRFSGSGAQNCFQSDAETESAALLEMECINIRELVAEFLPTGQSVDLLSVDCEGMDLDLIKNFPFDIVRPKVVLVEDFDYSEESEIHRSMTNLGYEMKSYAKITKIFVEIKYQ